MDVKQYVNERVGLRAAELRYRAMMQALRLAQLEADGLRAFLESGCEGWHEMVYSGEYFREFVAMCARVVYFGIHDMDPRRFAPGEVPVVEPDSLGSKLTWKQARLIEAEFALKSGDVDDIFNGLFYLYRKVDPCILEAVIRFAYEREALVLPSWACISGAPRPDLMRKCAEDELRDEYWEADHQREQREREAAQKARELFLATATPEQLEEDRKQRFGFCRTVTLVLDGLLQRDVQ